MAEQQLEQIEGTVEDIIYENTDNGYMVFEMSGGGVVTVVCGIVGELHAGESVVCRGRYENHATYGRQFHAQECETDMPKDLEAVYAFLASRSLPYIGAKTADKIIDLFGAEALEVIANDPARLTQVPGIASFFLFTFEFCGSKYRWTKVWNLCNVVQAEFLPAALPRHLPHSS